MSNKRYFENDNEDSQYEVPIKTRDKKKQGKARQRRFDDGEYVRRRKS